MMVGNGTAAPDEARQQRDGHGRDRRRDEPVLRRDDADRERPLGADAGLFGDLGDDRQERVGDVLRARHEDEKVHHERRQQRDGARIAPQYALGERHHERQAARRLHDGEGGHDGEDHAEHGRRRLARRHRKREHEAGEPEAGDHAEPDAADPGSGEDAGQAAA